MKKIIWILFASLLAVTAACSRNVGESADEHAGEAAQAPKGPHRGRLLTDGELQIEVTIFERGVPPEFHVYPYLNGKPLKPQDLRLSIELTRFGDRKESFRFIPREDYLFADAVVEEPHSFDVRVLAEYQGKQHQWTYPSYEGRTEIAAEMAKTAGIEIAVADSGTLRETLSLYGSIRANAERVRQISARYPGVIRSVAKNVGERVKAGDALAVIESNESLQNYTLTAPIGGVITERNANGGETTGAAPLFVVSDLSSVWAELSVFPRDRSKLAPGQAMRVVATDGKTSAVSRVGLVTATGQSNQSLVARVSLDNEEGAWTPGQFIAGEVTVSENKAPIVVPIEAVQKFRDWDVVFLSSGETYQAMPLQLGRSDGAQVEVLGGLKAGDRYVAKNSYLVKADIEKSGATHDH